MKPGDKVRAFCVWSENDEMDNVTYGRLESIPKAGEVFRLAPIPENRISGWSFGEAVAVSHWEDPPKIFVHTLTASWRIEKFQ